MIHGHVSFLGIVPAMLGTALLFACLMGRLPFTPWSFRSFLTWIVRERVPLALSVGITVLYALPILLHTLWHWPGEFDQYWAFLGKLPPQRIIAAVRYEASFIPGSGIWLLLFVVPDGIRRRIGNTLSTAPDPQEDLRPAGLSVFFAAALPAFWYSWREVDDTANSYLLLWLTPFAGTALVAALFYAVRATDLKLGRRILLCAVLGAVALRVVTPVQPELVVDVEGNLALQQNLNRLLAQPAPVGPERTELVLDRSAAAWPPVWIGTVELLDAFKRAGRHDLCVSAATWHILFEQSNRCVAGRVRITHRLFVTIWPRDPAPSSVRLGQIGMIQMSP